MGPRRARLSGGVVAGCALGAASGWNIANVGAVASVLGRDYSVTLGTVGLFTTALFLTHMGVQIAGGRASDRFGARRIGIAALLVICGGNALALAAPHPAVALLARAVTGLGTGAAFVAGSALVRESGGSALAQGIFGGLGLGAGGVALAVVPQLVGALAWRSPFATAAVVAAVAGGVVVTLAPRRVAGRPAAAPGVARAGVLGDRRLYPFAVLYSASFGLSVVVGNWAVEMLQRHGGLGGGAAATVGALTLVAGVVTRPLGGWVMRRRPLRVHSAVAASLAAGALGTAALLAGQPTWLAAAGSLLVGVGAGIPFAVAFTGAADARPDAPAASVGMVNGCANLVVLVGTPLVGVSFSLPGGGRIGFAVIAALWVLVLVLLRRPRSLRLTAMRSA